MTPFCFAHGLISDGAGRERKTQDAEEGQDAQEAPQSLQVSEEKIMRPELSDVGSM